MKILTGLADGQVLQRLGARGATAILAGEGPGDGPIRATILKANAALKGWKRKLVGRTVRGKFEIKLSAIPTGGPYRLLLECGVHRSEIASFFVGDVWILAGQSNMEGCGNMTGPAKPHPLVRAFSMRREWRQATEPLHILAESPDTSHAATQCTPELGERFRRTASKGVGAGLFFARDMLERTGGVPQGLICTAHGGTSMTQWSPSQKHLGGGSLYGSMLLSVRATGQPCAGLLWYQGESDANPADALVYAARMKQLVAASRRDLRQPELPWFVVQLGRVFSPWSAVRPWNCVQEEQRLLPSKIKNLATVPAIDLPLDDGIHIGAAGFPQLAARLASAADRLVHRNRRELALPNLRSIRVHETPSYRVEVTFDSVQGELRAMGEPSGFKLVSPEGTAQELIYKTELKGDTATLHTSDRPAAGTLLYYGFGLTPVCNIADARGFSLPVFGPVPLDNLKVRALLPFLTQWAVTEIMPADTKLNQLQLERIRTLPATVKNYSPDGFINEHATWETRSGHSFFRARLHLAEPMDVEFLMGYDGPFRLWLDDKSLFTDMKGTNPCLPDEVSKRVKLAAGDHAVCVGMDLNAGQAWGFYLRLARKDVPKAKISVGDFVKPTYSA